VFGVAAASRNTRFQAARYGLTWVGLAPTDRASFAWRLPSLDHRVGARKQGRRHLNAEGLGGPQVNDQLVFGRCLHRQVGRLLAFEYAVDIAGRGPILGNETDPYAMRPPLST
jgi:hypothetical protein